jgi:hypothetical protein
MPTRSREPHVPVPEGGSEPRMAAGSGDVDGHASNGLRMMLPSRHPRPAVRLGCVGVKVRVFGPDGYYPAKPFLSDDAVFLPFPDLVVTAVRQVRA